MPKPPEQRGVVHASLPGYATEIAAELNISTGTVCKYLRKLEKEGKAHIDKYPEKGIRRGARWAPGPAPVDAPKPPEKIARREAAKRARKIPSHVPYKNANTILEDAHVERARRNPATWFSSLESW
jgi:DNA-binding Lrp family transcriptional regulator